MEKNIFESAREILEGSATLKEDYNKNSALKFLARISQKELGKFLVDLAEEIEEMSEEFDEPHITNEAAKHIMKAADIIKKGN